MSVNINILNNTKVNDIGPISNFIVIKRSNSKELKGGNIIFLNGVKNVVSRYADSRKSYAFLTSIVNEYGVDINGIDVWRDARFTERNVRRLLVVLQYVFKAELLFYTTTNFYAELPPQFVGLRFKDKKNMTTFLLKYGHLL